MNWNHRRLKEKLLSRTLRYAAREVPYYRERVPQGVDRFALRLEDFPILEPEQFKEDPMAFVVLDRFPDFATLTGGTSGTPVLMFSNIDEYEAVMKHQHGLRPGEMLPTDELQGFSIHLVDLVHGLNPGTRHGLPVLKLPLERYRQGTVVQQLLEGGLPVAGRRLPVTGLTGTPSKLKLITGYLIEHDYDPRAGFVQQIVSYGGHMSQHWIQRLERYWGARVLSRFGMTEFAHDVPMDCDLCGGIHFTNLFVEYLHPVTREPVSEGAAVLTHTSLVPFSRVMPKIRYWTGDVVELTEACEWVDGERGCRFRGRLENLVLQGDDVVHSVLDSVDLVEALDPIEEVLKTDFLQDAFYRQAPPDRRAPFHTGQPVFLLSAKPSPVNPTDVTLLVESKDDLGHDPSAARRLRDDISSRIHAVAPDAETALATGSSRFVVEVLPPGGIKARGLEAMRA